MAKAEIILGELTNGGGTEELYNQTHTAATKAYNTGIKADGNKFVFITVTSSAGYDEWAIIKDGIIETSASDSWMSVSINNNNEIVVNNSFGSNLNSWVIKVIIYG